MSCAQRVSYQFGDIGDQVTGSFADPSTSGHPTESLVVIDSLTFRLTNGSTAANVTFNLDYTGGSSTVHVIGASFHMLAGESDTIHMPFPAGLPIWKDNNETSSIPPAIPASYLVAAVTSTDSTPAPGAGSFDLWIAYHWERPSHRR